MFRITPLHLSQVYGNHNFLLNHFFMHQKPRNCFKHPFEVLFQCKMPCTSELFETLLQYSNNIIHRACKNKKYSGQKPVTITQLAVIPARLNLRLSGTGVVCSVAAVIDEVWKKSRGSPSALGLCY